VDKRIQIAKEKYDNVHSDLLKEGINLLSEIELVNASLSKLSNYVGVSKTTIYEHFQSSFPKFLSEVLIYSRDKLRNKYLNKFGDDPLNNIVTLFNEWHEEILKNELFTKNAYAAYMLLKDTKLMPKPLMANDLHEQLSKLKIDKNQIDDFMAQYFYSSGVSINADRSLLDKQTTKIKNYLTLVSKNGR
jgi:AcrR family transcriptional regulator